MVKSKPARAPRIAKRKQFSLVPAEAQQQMYRALCALKANRISSGDASGAEIAEIAVCLAAGASCPLILACTAAGARIVSPQRADFGLAGNPFAGCAIGDGVPSAPVVGVLGWGEERRLTSATLASVDALLARSLNSSRREDAPDDAGSVKNARGRKTNKKVRAHPREEAAIVCAGLLDAGVEAERDYRAAFHFAARHRLPILYVVANRLTTGRSTLDLRSIYPEFGIPLFTVDANDAIAAYRVATEALHNARHLRGPSVIEALLVPAHGTAADPLHLLTVYMERHGNSPH